MDLRRLLLLLVIFVMPVAIACGSDGTVSDSAGADDTRAEDSLDSVEIESSVVKEARSFNPDSFVSAGWKKSKQYSTETVPDANEIWYGFFNQKDIEIRFYDDHATALSLGKPVAEAAIVENVKRSRGGELLDVSGGSFSAYNAYVVAGNAILLCELDISECEALVENLP